jgi:hypothetical protein
LLVLWDIDQTLIDSGGAGVSRLCRGAGRFGFLTGPDATAESPGDAEESVPRELALWHPPALERMVTRVHDAKFAGRAVNGLA